MNQATQPAVQHGLVSGTLAGIGTSVVASLAGKYLGISPATPINSVSHVIWGEKAARQGRPSIKYTLTGFVINQVASILWATLYEKLFGTRAKKGDIVAALAGSALISAVAYMVDYYLVPKRFTPGYEKRLPGAAVGLVYGGLALCLVYRGLMQRKKRLSASFLQESQYPDFLRK